MNTTNVSSRAFPDFSSFRLQACEPAAGIALEDVNAKEDLLPGYHLHLHWNDSGVRMLTN